MKRDWDLVQKLLADVEAVPAGQDYRFRAEDYPEHDEATVLEHLAMLVEEAGLLVGKPVRGSLGLLNVFVERLTWEGHDFLEATQVPGVWEKVRARVKESGGAATFEIVKGLVLGYAKSHFGLG